LCVSYLISTGVVPPVLAKSESSGLNLRENAVLSAALPRYFPLLDCCLGRIVWASSQR